MISYCDKQKEVVYETWGRLHHHIYCGVLTSSNDCFVFSHLTERMGYVDVVSRLFVPETLSSLGCPAVLQTVGPSELMEVHVRMVHVVIVRPWNDGKRDDEETMV